MARPGGGRSGGYRTLVVFRAGKLAIFVYGFAKSRMENVDARTLALVKQTAAMMLSRDEMELKRVLRTGELVEVRGYGE